MVSSATSSSTSRIHEPSDVYSAWIVEKKRCLLAVSVGKWSKSALKLKVCGL